jgi:hypothetical protein
MPRIAKIPCIFPGYQEAVFAARAHKNGVVVRITEQTVMVAAPFDVIVAERVTDGVVVGVPDQRVITAATVDRVVAGRTGHRVGLGRRLVRRPRDDGRKIRSNNLVRHRAILGEELAEAALILGQTVT